MPYYVSQVISITSQIKSSTESVLDKKIRALYGSSNPSQQQLLDKFKSHQATLDFHIDDLIDTKDSDKFKEIFGEHVKSYQIKKLEINIKAIEKIEK